MTLVIIQTGLHTQWTRGQFLTAIGTSDSDKLRIGRIEPLKGRSFSGFSGMLMSQERCIGQVGLGLL